MAGNPALLTKADEVLLKADHVSIAPLLKRLAYPDNSKINVSAGEIASAFALIFDGRLSVIQTAALLTLLHSTGLDREADVIAQCANRMREAATTADRAPLRKVIKARGRKEGTYRGGLVSQLGIGVIIYFYEASGN
jgi:anthranilate phosphoribosyltransferase